MCASCCVQIYGRELRAPKRPAGDLQHNRRALQFVLLGECLNSGKICAPTTRLPRLSGGEALGGAGGDG